MGINSHTCYLSKKVHVLANSKAEAEMLSVPMVWDYLHESNFLTRYLIKHIKIQDVLVS